MTKSTFDQKAHSSRKDTAHRSKVKPFLPDVKDNESELFSIFKITTKIPKRTSGLNSEVPVMSTDLNASESYSARRLTQAEYTDQDNQKDEEIEKVTFDLNEFIDLCDNSESTVQKKVHESAAIKEYETVGKACCSPGRNHADLGCSSFTAEKSPVSSDLFYLPESYLDLFVPVRSSEESSWLEGVFSCVERLLSHSPPPLNKLCDFEKMERSEETISPSQEAISNSHSERLQDKDFPASSEVDHSLLPSENPEVKASSDLCASVNTCFSKPVSSLQTADDKVEELHWSDSFDSLFDNEELTEIEKKTLTINYTPANNSSSKRLVQEDKECLETNKRSAIIDEEKSIHLFEDEHIYETNTEISSVNNEPSVMSASGGNVSTSAAVQGSEWLPSRGDKTCKEQQVSSKITTVETVDDISVTEQSLDNNDLYDASQELFSVNFDLGFSIEECEDEILEDEVNPNNTPELNGALQSHTGVTEDREKILNDSCRFQTLPKWDCKSLERRNISTPLPFWSSNVSPAEVAGDAIPAGPVSKSGNRRRSGSHEALASPLSTPCRRVRNIEAIKRNPVNVFSRVVEEIAGVHPTDKVDTSSHGQNFESSALDALDSPLGRSANLEDTNIRASRVCPAEGRGCSGTVS